MALDINTLATSILNAMKGVLTATWPSVASLAAGESQKLGQTLITLESMLAAGTISKAQANAFLDLQTHATKSVLLAIEGIGIVVAEQAVNAGLAAVSQSVDSAVGFSLV
jgi:hypothetical protein